MKEREPVSGIDWAVAQRPMPGESISGDHPVLKAVPDGILLAVIDGLGHGPEAARASTLAGACLAEAQTAHGLPAMIRECHEALRGTRGAAMTVALYQPGSGTLQWASIGNVEGVLWQRPGRPDAQRQCVTLRGGVVGYQLPAVHVSTLPVAAGDICCLASDGISSSFVEKNPAYLEPRLLADYILEHHGRTSDDALVLVVRFSEAV